MVGACAVVMRSYPPRFGKAVAALADELFTEHAKTAASLDAGTSLGDGDAADLCNLEEFLSLPLDDVWEDAAASF